MVRSRLLFFRLVQRDYVVKRSKLPLGAFTLIVSEPRILEFYPAKFMNVVRGKLERSCSRARGAASLKSRLIKRKRSHLKGGRRTVAGAENIPRGPQRSPCESRNSQLTQITANKITVPFLRVTEIQAFLALDGARLFHIPAHSGCGAPRTYTHARARARQKKYEMYLHSRETQFESVRNSRRAQWRDPSKVSADFAKRRLGRNGKRTRKTNSRVGRSVGCSRFRERRESAHLHRHNISQAGIR